MCGKTKMFGRHIRYKHGGKWERRAPRRNRVFEPNVQKTKIPINGVMRSVRICTRCMRTLQKV
jgi:ribosomal protein L28